MELKRLSSKHKNNKLLYYLRNYCRLLLPNSYYQQKLDRKLNSISDQHLKSLQSRLNYYNQLSQHQSISSSSKKLSYININEDSKTYFFDFREFHRYFDQSLNVEYAFGDITHVPDVPTFVKSRPIKGNNENSILLKWDKVRHFTFVKRDRKSFLDKENKLVFRGKVHHTQPHRIKFMELYNSHPLCNVGKVNKNNLPDQWNVNRMTIEEQLNYKFILSLEGNDVASNLKWVMSSNSVAVMPQPKFETWFMEGQLIPDHHYIEIKEDYSNLEERLDYFTKHPQEAMAINRNAKQYVTQFQDKENEILLSLLVLEKYFKYTGQL